MSASPSFRYWSGEAVHSKTLTAHPAKDFGELVTSLCTDPPVLSATYEYFHALPKLKQSETKTELPYLTPCTFSASPWHGRKKEHARECYLIFIDVDNSDDAARLEKPGVLAGLLKGRNWLAYKTVSHTPDKPRLRVMLEADGILPDCYADAVRAIASKLGLRELTPESEIVCQPMFVPCLFQGQHIDFHDPHIDSRFDGKAFTQADIEEGLSFSSDAPACRQIVDTDTDGLEFIKMPLEGYTPDMIRDMLSMLDPDMKRAPWLIVAASLKHQFAADPEQGYELFEDWSATAKSKYVESGPRSPQALWDSLTASPTDRKPVTLRTLIQMAEKAGWIDPRKALVNQAQAVNCEVIRPLPRICCAADLIENERKNPRPQVLVASLLHIGEKLLLAGASKSYKSWTLLDLAVSVGTGSPFWGLPTTKGRVLLLNYEIRPYFFAERLQKVQKAKGCGTLDNVDVWNLRGHRAGFDRVLAELRQLLKTTKYALVIIDPLYSGLAGRSENDAAEMAAFMNSIEELTECGPAVALGHHFAKGNSAMRESLDRASGSGVFARDPDGIVTLNRHQSAEAFVAEFTLRNFAPVDRMGLRLDFPLLVPDNSLDVEMIKGAQVRKTATATVEDIVSLLPAADGMKAAELESTAGRVLHVGRSKFYALLREAKGRDLIQKANGVYTRHQAALPSPPLTPEKGL